MTPPEINLLLACAATPAADPASVRTICARISDWPSLIEAADHHGVLGLLGHAVKAANASPPDIAKRLDAALTNAVKRTLYFEAELERLQDAFRRARLDAIALKGPTLARALYDDPALRPCSDLDFIVRREDIAAAIRLLGDEGYHLPAHLAALPLAALLVLDCEARLIGPATCVDLQWAAAPRDYPFQFDPGLFWRARDAGADRLSSAMFVFLCVHGAKHAWSRLIWLADIARMTNRLDWNEVIALAAEARCDRPLLLGLGLAHGLLHANVPDAFIAKIQNDPAVLRALEESRARLTRLPPEEPGAFSLTRFNAGLAPDARSSLRHYNALIRAPTEAELRIVTLPGQLFFLYYPLRVIRFSLKQIRRFLSA